MDQSLTGRFIAEERKKKGYTQQTLAEKLSISNKTVSKWETGKGFPDVSLLLPLCAELDISVNELLAGERISKEEYEKTAEENMMKMITKVSKEEKIISTMLSVALLVIAATACILVKVFASPEVIAAVGILNVVSLICIVSVWIATTLSLKNK